MICDFTLRNFTLNERQEKTLQKRLLSLKKKLVRISPDILKVSLVIKKHEKNEFYSGVFTVAMPLMPLVAKTGGHSVEEVIHKGFAKLEQEFVTYKGKHFQGDSTYHDHRTIRMTHL